MDLVNFKVGKKYIALSILDILLTERYQQDLTVVPSEDDSFIGVKDYMGAPTPVFDLGLIMNSQSSSTLTHALQTQFANLLSESMNWHNDVQKLAESKDHPQAEAKPLGDCWDNQYLQHLQNLHSFVREFETDDSDLKNIVEKLESPLAHIQTLYDQHAELRKAMNGKSHLDARLNGTSLQKHLGQLVRTLESALDQVSQSYKPIIVYTTTDGRSPYIGLLVDSVGENINVQEKEVKTLNKIGETGFRLDPQTQKMLTGIVKCDQRYSLLLDPTAIFKPDSIDAKAS